MGIIKTTKMPGQLWTLSANTSNLRRPVSMVHCGMGYLMQEHEAAGHVVSTRKQRKANVNAQVTFSILLNLESQVMT